MKKLLVIEDDQELRSIYSDWFNGEGFETLSAAMGSEGLEIARNQHPDLILLDVMLPGGMNGFDVLEELKKKPDLSIIPVIMLTNLDSEEKTARKIGVADYIIKANTSLAELTEKVRHHVGTT